MPLFKHISEYEGQTVKEGEIGRVEFGVSRHKCTGASYQTCIENANGKLIFTAQGGNYTDVFNYCPFCGWPAAIP